MFSCGCTLDGRILCPEHKRTLPRVDVYREHPEWGEVSRWFWMRTDLLRDLYVTSYEVSDERPVDEKHPGIVAIRKEHPGAVLVY